MTIIKSTTGDNFEAYNKDSIPSEKPQGQATRTVLNEHPRTFGNLETPEGWHYWVENDSIERVMLDDAFNWLNARYAFNSQSSRTASNIIVKQFEQGKFVGVDFTSHKALKNKFAGLAYRVKDDDGKYLTEMCLVDEWFKSLTNRKSYDKIIFDPNQKVEDCEEKKILNLFCGFDPEYHLCEPDFGEDSISKCQAVLKQIEHIFCGNDKEMTSWFLDWLADIVQNPGERRQSAVIIKSKQGMGKDAFGNYLKKMLAQYAIFEQTPYRLLHGFRVLK